MKDYNLRILVIDDNPSIHQDFIKILRTNINDQDLQFSPLEVQLFGKIEESNLPVFEVDTAYQGKEGLEKITKKIQENKPYALAFVDIRMPPGWDGIETIKHIWEVDPTIQIVICTAYSDYSWEETVKALGQRDNLLILKKPFDNITVRQLASALTKKWQLLQESKTYTSSLEKQVLERTETLNQSLSLMRATLESTADGVLVINDNKVIIDFNKKLIDMFELSDSFLENKQFDAFTDYILQYIDVDKMNEFKKEALDTVIKKEKTVKGNIKFKDGKFFEYYTQPFQLNHETMGRVWCFRDITKRALLEEKLQYQATHDQLTGLPNRVILNDRLKQACVDADKNSTQFAVLFLDLDRFKLINDSLTHEAGDRVLCIVAERLKNIIRSDDALVRIGGDEFVILVNKLVNRAHIDNICQKIIASFDEPIVVNQHSLNITISIGIALYPQDSKSIDELLRNADIAMYCAKESGINQYAFFSAKLNQFSLEKLEREAELRQAITKNEFVIYYQPQIELKTGKLISIEALIRWQHPTKGIILPMDFIPLTEETGLIIPIGEWVLQTACQQLKEWQDAGLPHIRVAVNITTKQLRFFNIVKTIQDVLTKTGLDAQYLELELTENTIINNLDIIDTIHELKKLGIKIALDDFGSGYSSLNYLRQIPVDRLKIDQSYVQDLDSNRDNNVLLKAIITMANNLHLEVLAEGVETQKQIDYLKLQNCGEVQGFYFSTPISAKKCEEYLKNSQTVDFNILIDKD